MPISGILLTCKPEHVEDVSKDLHELEWTETHYEEPDGRFVLIVEAESTEIGMSRLLHLQSLPLVASAEMFEHFMGDEAIPTDSAATHEIGMDRLNSAKFEPRNKRKK